MKVLGYMARNQHGQTEHGLKHPRKDLMARTGSRHAEKMYVDCKDMTARHVGYVIGGNWWTVYAVCEWQGGDR